MKKMSNSNSTKFYEHRDELDDAASEETMALT